MLAKRLVSLVGLAGFDVEVEMTQASRSTMKNGRTMRSGWIAAITTRCIST